MKNISKNRLKPTRLAEWKSNFHTHSIFCDGKAKPEAFITKAIELGFDCIGFSSHAPLPFHRDWTLKSDRLSSYIREIARLKEVYRDRIEILAGLEVDFIPGIQSPSDFCDEELDYIIGSVHFLPVKPGAREMTRKDCTEWEDNYLEIDYNPEQLKRVIEGGYGGDVRAMIHTYYSSIRDMLTSNPPTILGHMDVVKKYNKGNTLFNPNDTYYLDEIEQTLDVLRHTSTILEVNTASIYLGYDAEPYPSSQILRKCREYDIPLMLDSDAHSPEALGRGYPEAIRILQECGYDTLYGVKAISEGKRNTKEK
jgi:histidinol-phosphatase (PHP family)